MKIVGVLNGECEDGKTCPRVLETDEPDHVLVQGDRIDPAVVPAVPEHETLVRVPRRLVDGTPHLMAPGEFGDWYDAHLNRSMQRLETLRYYDPDRIGYAEWQRGATAPDWDRKRSWLSRVRADRDAGIVRRRVRIVREPLTDYERFECQWGYVPLAEHGEEIRILDLTEVPFPLAAVGDFSVFDDEHAVRMHYDAGGVFVGASVVERDLPFFLALRDLLWQAAHPFGAWWARHPEHHRVGAYPL